MTEAQAIALLEGMGYVVVKPSGEGNPYLVLGETWENNPKVYRGAWAPDKAAMSALLDAVDAPAMIARWRDETIRSVIEWGSDLAFNRKQMTKINAACRAEILKRYPVVSRAANGMVE